MTSISESSSPAVKEAPRAKGRIGELLTAAQGESVKQAMDADQRPLEFEVMVDGNLAGVYKGKSAENLERVIHFLMDEVGTKNDIHVRPVATPTEPDPAPADEVSAG